MSVFDDIQQIVFSGTQSVFGDTAVWTPSDSSIAQTEKVLFNCPTEPVSIGSSDRYEYRPYKYWFEYSINQFLNLKTLVDNGNVQYLIVKGYNLVIKEVNTKFDVQTYIAYAELNND